MPLFTELALVLIIATLVSFIMRTLKQPLVVGYILTGIICGPMVLHITQANESFELFAKIGIAILLFIVGLHLRPDVIKEVGKVSLIVGLSQVLFTSIIGFGIALALGLDQIAALYVSIALTFSSTIIILKLLSDKGHVHTLYGRISVGMLLVQDLVATLVLLLVSSTGGTHTLSLGESIGWIVLKTLIVGIVLAITVKWMLPRILEAAGDNQELLFLFSLSWGLGTSIAFQFLGLSVEIGALIAGVVISTSPFSEEISAKLRPLRDFFIIIFFIMLGSHMEFSQIVPIVPEVIILSLFVLIGNPIIVFIVMNLLGYHKRTGFMTGLTVAQISEFSLILATLGFQLGHLDQQTVTLITLVGLITIAGSTYLILYSDAIYSSLINVLTYLELRKPKAEMAENKATYNALILGFTHIGEPLIKSLRSLDLNPLVIDYNPEMTEMLMIKNIPFMYGDAGNPEFLNELPLESLKIVISGINDTHVNLAALIHLKKQYKHSIFILFSRNETDVKSLKDAGATVVINPLKSSAKQLASFITEAGIRPTTLKQAYKG